MKANYFLKKVFNCLLFRNFYNESFDYNVLEKSKYFSVIIVLLSLIIPYFTSAQVTYSPEQKWKWIHPKPQGSALRWCKMWDSNNWYMAGNSGIFMKTTDAGQSWYITYKAGREETDRVRGDIWDAHFFNQNTGILVGTRHTVFKTTDGGITFDSIQGLYSTEQWRSVFFLNNNTGYVTGFGSLAKTIDSGNNWVFNNSINPSVFHYKLYTINDTLIFVCSSGGNIQRSTNGGASWTTISTGSSSQLQCIKFLNENTGFVCGTGGAVRLTTDKGLTWNSVNNSIPINSYYDIDFKISGPTTEVFLTGNGQYIYKTTNLGQSWDTVGFWGDNQTNFGPYQVYMSTEFGGEDTLLTVGYSGLINKRNSVSDRHLFSDFAKFGAANVYDIWVENNSIWGVGRTSSVNRFDQVIYSSNSGSSWVVQDVGASTAYFNSIYMLNSNTGYIVGGENIATGVRGRIRKTLNGGVTWDSLESPTNKRLTRVNFVNPNTGWIFGETSTIYKTTNGAANWVQQTAPTSNVLYTNSAMLNENTGWFVGYVENTVPTTSIVNKTTDGGLTWGVQNPNIGPIGRAILCIDMLDENNGYLAGYLNVRKTTNGGVNWDSVALPFPEFQISGLDFINPQTGMLLDTYGSTTLKTTNGGTSWVVDYLGTQASYDINYFTSFTKMKMVNENTAFTGSDLAGILKYSSTTIGITEWQSGVPEKYELFQNYPNPFNPNTTIKFAIPKTGSVSLKVYDITGREVRTLINNMQINAGTVTHSFDGSNIASGIYFYTLYVDDNLINTKKMILIK